MEHNNQSIMPDKEIVDSLISEFTCPICREILTKPQKACKWGHTFCQECLGKSIKSKAQRGEVPSCPLCRAVIKPHALHRLNRGSEEDKIRQEKVLQLLRLRGHEHTTDDGQMPVSQGPPSDAQQQSAPINHAPPDR
ncbi:hypothetical protein NPX13_g1168 [Xylaria arbuscula]|uniref:RING-type domain-containing protein n=1 Tax=Xylaria arbuscula TaxID=114810 RepID=A0A9W8TRG7_9PEZI|nr:hypothetical protein NPX13_g1168 [Xylaria arbuscula]